MCVNSNRLLNNEYLRSKQEKLEKDQVEKEGQTASVSQPDQSAHLDGEKQTDRQTDSWHSEAYRQLAESETDTVSFKFIYLM